MTRTATRFALCASAWLGAFACTESGQVLGPAPEATITEPPPPAMKAASRVASGEDFSCALMLDGSAYCWGSNEFGQLGIDRTGDQLRPAKVSGSERFRELCAGNQHACALSDDGEVWCWGRSQRGQLGQGNRTNLPRPIQVPLDGAPTALTCGFAHTCVLASGGELWCWGKNGEGELAQSDTFPGNGNEPTVDGLSPVRLGGTALYRAVGLGDGHTCAVRADGTLWCSGRNTQRQLGPATGEGQARRLLQVGSDDDWLQVIAGMNHSCGLRTDRRLWCFGTNTALASREGFPLGVPGEVVPEPTRVATTEWLLAATDTFHTCAIALGGGELWCWGRNAEGQLGSEDVSLRDAPTLLARRAISVDVASFTTCLVDTAGVVACAGDNDRGQLGTGDTERRYAFTDIPIDSD